MNRWDLHDEYHKDKLINCHHADDLKHITKKLLDFKEKIKKEESDNKIKYRLSKIIDKNVTDIYDEILMRKFNKP